MTQLVVEEVTLGLFPVEGCLYCGFIGIFYGLNSNRAAASSHFLFEVFLLKLSILFLQSETTLKTAYRCL